MKHTPGPWLITKDETQIIGKDGYVVHEIFGMTDEEVKTETANAHLIAAAPDILKLLKDYLNEDRCVCDEADLEIGSCLACLAEEAITKAEGKAS